MSFNRTILPPSRPDPDTLTAMLAGIGINLAATPIQDPNIEDTLFFGTEVGMRDGDLRTLSLVTQWLEIHSRWVLADRLVRVVEETEDGRIKAYWSAVGQWLEGDRRFARLVKLHHGKPIDLLPTGTDFQIRRNGEDRRFAGTALRVPASTLRSRETDVLLPVELARIHRAYRWRVVMGPTYRADMWAALERNPSLTPAELARSTYGSFATAHQVKREWEIVRQAHQRTSPLCPGAGRSAPDR